MMLQEILELTYSAYEKAMKEQVPIAIKALEAALIKITMEFDLHPVEYEGPCFCRLCQSYA